MSYRQQRYAQTRRERRRGNGCLWSLVILVWVVLIGILVYRFVFLDAVSQQIGDLIGEQISGPGQTELGQQLEQGAQDALPTVVAGLPAGDLRITEQEANAFLAARANLPQPIESVRVRFVPDQLETDVTALGTISTLRTGLVVQDGRIIATKPEVSGVLGQVIDAQRVIQAVEDQLNEQLATQGRRVTNVQILQGEMLVSVE